MLVTKMSKREDIQKELTEAHGRVSRMGGIVLSALCL